jgi:polyferredoxin
MRTQRQKIARIVRWAVLAASAVFFLFFSSVISEHAICPIGGFELFFTSLFGTGFTVAGLLSGMTLVFLIMSALSLVFRRAYCGYICPMGALQELFDRIGSKVLPKRLRAARVPHKVDRALRWVKYGVLLAFIVCAAIIGGHWMISADPYIAMMSLFLKGGLASAWARFPVSVIFLFSILMFAFFLGRGFCKYICPAGAWYAILSKVSPFAVIRDESKCLKCGKCSASCPMGLDVANAKRIADGECIGCQECVNACPADGALKFEAGKSTIPACLLPMASAAVFSGSVAFAVSTMPARGARPQGAPGAGGVNGGTGGTGAASSSVDGTSGASLQKGSGVSDKGSARKVSFGGCANCSGCGICKLVSSSDVTG